MQHATPDAQRAGDTRSAQTSLAMMLRLLLAIFLCPYAILSAAADITVKSDSDGILRIYNDGQNFAVPLEIQIADWRISCNQQRAVVWGQTTKQLPIGVVPYATVYVIDLLKGGVLNSFTTTRGPFDVDFDASGSIILIDEYVLDARSGEIKSTEIPKGFVFEAESCK